jgi:hypothetical protein
MTGQSDVGAHLRTVIRHIDAATRTADVLGDTLLAAKLSDINDHLHRRIVKLPLGGRRI